MTYFEVGLILTLVGLGTIVGVLVSALAIEYIALEKELRRCQDQNDSVKPYLVASQSVPRSLRSE